MKDKMREQQMLYCLFAFILGYLVSKPMGNGFRNGEWSPNISQIVFLYVFLFSLVIVIIQISDQYLVIEKEPSLQNQCPHDDIIDLVISQYLINQQI